MERLVKRVCGLQGLFGDAERSRPEHSQYAAGFVAQVPNALDLLTHGSLEPFALRAYTIMSGKQTVYGIMLTLWFRCTAPFSAQIADGKRALGET